MALAQVASDRWPWIKIVITSGTVSEIRVAFLQVRRSCESRGAPRRSWPTGNCTPAAGANDRN